MRDGFLFCGVENGKKRINCVTTVDETLEEVRELLVNVMLVRAEHDDTVEVTVDKSCHYTWSIGFG